MRHCIALLFILIAFQGNSKNPFLSLAKEWQFEQVKTIQTTISQKLLELDRLKKEAVQLEEKIQTASIASLPLASRYKLSMALNEKETSIQQITENVESLKERASSISMTGFINSEEFKKALSEGIVSSEDIEWLKSGLSKAEGIHADAMEVSQVLRDLDMDIERMPYSEIAMQLEDKLGVEKASQVVAKLERVRSFSIENPADAERLLSENTDLLHSVLPKQTQKVSELHEKASGIRQTIRKATHEGVDIEEVILSKKESIKDHLFAEADLGILSTDKNLVNISPMLGYRLSNRISFGLGASYQNMNGLNQELGGALSGRLMTRFYFLKDILSVQLEGISGLGDKNVSGSQAEGVSRFSQLIGGRISMPEGSKIPFAMSLMHSLNSDAASPAYMAPWQFKLGLNF